MKLLPACLLLLLLVGAAGCRMGIPYGKWTVQTTKRDADSLAWSPFFWKGDRLGQKYYDRTVMDIPATVAGLSRPVTFQFDLGANITMFYGNPLSGLTGKKIRKEDYGPLSVSFGDLRASTEHAYVIKDFGDEPQGDTVHLGTIGADLFRDKVLIIDYPGLRFAVGDTVPRSWGVAMTPVSLDPSGRMVLPLQIGRKTFRAMFDNGSSLFPLIAPARHIHYYPAAAPTDTIPITSWGKAHNVVGRPLNAPFTLGGYPFEGTVIWADYRPEAVSEDYDVITGNALFWDHVIILDFRHRRFGIKLK